LTAVPVGHGDLRGDTKVGSLHVNSTGVLGVSANPVTGRPGPRGFPSWATVPGYRSLADGRRWHFFFAWLFVINGLSYLLWSWRSRHLGRDLWPTREDWRGMGHSIVEHLKFKHPTGEAATRYNILQKLAYLGVVLALGPGVVLMGLAMSPHMDSVLSWLVDLVGGRQSARTIHFLIAMAFVAFILVHVFMVLVTGPINQIRAMITGRYRIHDEPGPEEPGHEEPAHD
jgi:thiosulfate reductase cytochrome b subunit